MELGDDGCPGPDSRASRTRLHVGQCSSLFLQGCTTKVWKPSWCVVNAAHTSARCISHPQCLASMSMSTKWMSEEEDLGPLVLANHKFDFQSTKGVFNQSGVQADIRWKWNFTQEIFYSHIFMVILSALCGFQYHILVCDDTGRV